jgi:hypothetical protein
LWKVTEGNPTSQNATALATGTLELLRLDSTAASILSSETTNFLSLRRWLPNLFDRYCLCLGHRFDVLLPMGILAFR